jgi:hypothetical protein
LGCLEQRPSRHITSDQASVRLRGKFCRITHHDMKSVEGVRVRNLTNGFEGTIFFHGNDASFVTDALKLEPGRNFIQLEWRALAGAPSNIYTAEIVQQP